jgi:very-short-patch-repair endonuclease
MAPGPRLKALAKAMRREPVMTERTLWRVLRDRRLEGLKFRRQVVIGRYIVDFLCLRHRLIVEADGPFHEDNAAHDAERDAWLASQRFRVVRFANLRIETRAHEVVTEILEAVRPAAEKFVDPSSDAFGATFSRKGRREG